LDRYFKKSIDVVPIIFDGVNQLDVVSIPMLFELICKDIELLVVCVLINGGLSLQAVDNEL